MIKYFLTTEVEEKEEEHKKRNNISDNVIPFLF
jgi:hypothetical protein